MKYSDPTSQRELDEGRAMTRAKRRREAQRKREQEAYERGVRDGLSRAREEEFKRGDLGHPDNDMGM